MPRVDASADTPEGRVFTTERGGLSGAFPGTRWRMKVHGHTYESSGGFYGDNAHKEAQESGERALLDGAYIAGTVLRNNR